MMNDAETVLKLATASSVHRATLGIRADGSMFMPQRSRPALVDLLERYGMWVHRCVTLNAQVAASVPFGLFTKAATPVQQKYCSWLQPISSPMRAYLKGQQAVQPSQSVKARIRGSVDDLTEITEHEVLNVLTDVNDWTDGYAWRESLYADLQIFGRAYSAITGPQSDKELWRLAPQRMKVIPSEQNFVTRFEYGVQPTIVNYAPEDLLWFKLFDPFDPWGGYGPLEAWLRTIDASFAIQDYQHWLMHRHGVPDVIVKTKQELDPAQKRSFRSSFRRMFGTLRKRQENVAFISGEGEIEKFGQTNKELEFSQSAGDIRDQIGQAFGVPKSMLTTDDVNRSNSRESVELYTRTTIWPMIQRVEDVLNERLLPKFGEGLILIHENPVPEDRAIRMEERVSQLRSGYSVNQILADDGRETLAIPEADEPLIPLDLQPLSRVNDEPNPADIPAAPLPKPDDEDDDEAEADDEVVVDGKSGVPAIVLITVTEAITKGELTLDAARAVFEGTYGVEPDEAKRLLPDALEPEGIITTDRMKTLAQRMDWPPEMVGLLRQRFTAVLNDEVDDIIARRATLNGGGGKKDDPTPEVIDQSTMLQKDDLGDVTDPGFTGHVNPEMAEAIAKRMRAQAQEVIDRLEPKKGRAARKAPPHAHDLPQWLRDDEIERWQAELAEDSRLALRLVIIEAGAAALAGIPSGIAFEVVNPRTTEYLLDAGRRIGESVTDTWRKQIRESLIAGIEAGENIRQIADRIRAIQGADFVQWKAEQIARTETGFAQIAGSIEGWRQSGVVAGKRYVLAPDACPFCRAIAAEYEKVNLALDQPFRSLGSTIEAEFPNGKRRILRIDYRALQGPPIHPNCRCALQPIIKEVVDA